MSGGAGPPLVPARRQRLLSTGAPIPPTACATQQLCTHTCTATPTVPLDWSRPGLAANVGAGHRTGLTFLGTTTRSCLRPCTQRCPISSQDARTPPCAGTAMPPLQRAPCCKRLQCRRTALQTGHGSPSARGSGKRGHAVSVWARLHGLQRPAHQVGRCGSLRLGLLPFLWGRRRGRRRGRRPGGSLCAGDGLGGLRRHMCRGGWQSCRRHGVCQPRRSE